MDVEFKKLRTMGNVSLNIAEDFHQALGGRTRDLGPNSGQEFYEDKLLPKYNEAEASKTKLDIYLDGTRGYGSSFLDQSFGQLFREKGSRVKDIIIFHTTFFDWIVDYIQKDIWKK